MSYAWSAIVFSLGFFALAAQTLLFRSFLTAFEGNELGVGSFFGSWLIWVSLGALLGRIAARAGQLLRTRFAWLALLYLPGFVLQDLAIANARAMAGVASYEIFPLHMMIGVSSLANAPVSFLTGFLFTVACRSARGTHALPVARVYVLESLGGFAGGIAVTLLLAAGVREEAVFLYAALVLSLAAALFVALEKGYAPLYRCLGVAAPGVVAFLLAAGVDDRWAEASDRLGWERLLPADAYRGSFSTAQGKYLYGEREGQFMVMSWGGVSEALPNEEHASEVLALTLAQRPSARNLLVVGPGALAICLRFAQLPQIETISWLHPDPEYPRALRAVLPEEFQRAASGLEISDLDVRAFIERTTVPSDIILLNLPDVTTLVLNRYSTVEFFSLLKRALAPGGIVAMRISGGANYLGGELVYLGSSAFKTLESAFSHVALKPGDESWLIASDGNALSQSPALLRDRFAAIEGAAAVYPPGGLLSLYPPDRVEFQLGKYRRAAADTNPELLVNTDQRPKALLYSLAVALRRAARRGVSSGLQILMAGGPWTCASAILLYAFLRFFYLLTFPRPFPAVFASRVSHVFDGTFLVLSTGLAGMSLSVALMFLYQSRHGSLYLHVGLAASLFMLGLFLGGLFVERLLGRCGREPGWLLPGLVVCYLGVTLLVFLAPEDAQPIRYAVLFALSGLVTGACFPLGAHRMSEAGRSPAAAGAALETVDHFGGALGAVLTGLLLLPAFGAHDTLALLALLVAVNLIPALLANRPLAEQAPFEGPAAAKARAAAYVMFGGAAFLLIASNIVSAVETGQESRMLEASARDLSGSDDLKQGTAHLTNGRAVSYFANAGASGEVDGYIFSTRRLAGDISGYGGPIVLAVHVARQGALRGFRVLRSRETPAYLALLEKWRKDLPGRNIFGADAFADVDGVTGATMSSNAILQTLEHAGRTFASEVLAMDVSRPARPARSWMPDANFLCLALLMSAAIALRYVAGVWVRRLCLAASFLAAGLWLNLQFSTQQVCSILSLQLPAFALTGGFFLAFAVPLLVLLFGNVYCGYVCPFGALQELAGDLRPRSRHTDPGKTIWAYGRAVKYVLLAALIALFALSRDFTVLSADPLITFFGEVGGGLAFWMGIAAVLISLFFRRFWCRNLCPAGAFLALLNRLRLLRKLLPRTYPGRCDLGVRTPLELDCLCCDRCRNEKS